MFFEQALDAKYQRLHCLFPSTAGDMDKLTSMIIIKQFLKASFFREACPDMTLIRTTSICETGGSDARLPVLQPLYST